jgi:hypothetical protein
VAFFGTKDFDSFAVQAPKCNWELMHIWLIRLLALVFTLFPFSQKICIVYSKSLFGTASWAASRTALQLQ